ncbi:hypothetical protein VTH82DRAFT_2491 [Thermothelomyces myriococcoides]
MDPSAHRGSPSRPLQSRHRDNKNDEENQQRSRFSRTETLAGFRIYQPSRRRDRSPAAASSAALPSVYWDNKKNKEIDGESDANLAGYTFYREPTPTPPEFEDSEKRVGHGGPRLAAFTDSSTAGGGTIRSDGDHSQRPLNLGGAAGWNGGADNNSIAISPRTKKKALWGIFAIGALVLIGVAVGVGVGLGIGLKAKGETVKPTDIPSSSIPELGPDTSPVPTDTPTTSVGGTSGSAATATRSSPAPRPTYNSDCPALNNTIYHVPGSTKSFLRVCGIDYSGSGATDLIHTWTESILGREIVKQLASNPEKWKTIYALSRSKKDEYPPNVVHKHIDLLSSADQMAQDLQGIEAEYIFFAAYLQKDTEQENWQVNGDMLSNFLSAVSHANTKRILLVTGAKQYGVHLGQPKNPLFETDPWLTSDAFPPNFYYRQQAILHEFCAKHKDIHWTVTYPNDVIGFAKGNFMNLATGIGLYAAVSRELAGPDEGLTFPGSLAFYTRFDTFTSAALHARFCEWAALEPRAADQAFNVANGDVQSWQDLWPRLARRFGTHVREDQFSGRPSTTSAAAAMSECAAKTQLVDPPPVSIAAKEAGLVGRVKPSTLEQTVNLAKWSQREDVRRVWDRLAEREGLQKDAFDQATWAFVDFVLGRDYDIVQSMSKARDAGWTGYQDTWKAFSDVFGELEAARILPKTH